MAWLTKLRMQTTLRSEIRTSCSTTFQAFIFLIQAYTGPCPGVAVVLPAASSSSRRGGPFLTQQWQSFYPLPAAAAAAVVLQPQQHRRNQHGCCQRTGSPEARPPGGAPRASWGRPQPQRTDTGGKRCVGPTDNHTARLRKKIFERPEPFCPANWRPVHKCIRAGCQRGLLGVPWGSLGPWSSLRFLMVSWGTLGVLGVLGVPGWSLGFLRHGRLIGH